MLVTLEIMNKGRSRNGAWSEKQLKCLGTTTRDGKGWLHDIIGTEVSEYRVADFLYLKDAHLKKNKTVIHLKRRIRILEQTNKKQAKRIKTLLSLERMEKAS